MEAERIAAGLPTIQKTWLKRAVITHSRDGMIVSSRMAECMRFNLIRKGIITSGRRSILLPLGLEVKRILETKS